MQIAGLYSVQNAQTILESCFPQELAEVQTVIACVDSRTISALPPRQRLKRLNQVIRHIFSAHQWRNQTLVCEYSLEHYTQEWQEHALPCEAIRELDFVKNKIGVDILFKKTEPTVYDICAEMTIFHNRGFVEAGIGIVPVLSFARTLSSKCPSFEQLVWDLQHRGVSNIDIPVLILGVTA